MGFEGEIAAVAQGCIEKSSWFEDGWSVMSKSKNMERKKRKARIVGI